MSCLVPATPVRIRATAAYLPKQRITNAELAASPGAPLDAAAILKLTGIQERRRAAEHEAASDLAIAAGRLILQRAGAARVSRLIVSTTSGDMPTPATACLVQHALELAPCPAVDVAAACAGFLFGLDWGVRALLTGDTSALVIASEVRSRFIDPRDRGTFSLFGDGAGGALLETGPGPGHALLGLTLHADGAGAHTIRIPAGGSRLPASDTTVALRQHNLHMQDGPGLFLAAIETMTQTAQDLLDRLGLTLADIDLVVPHQPNMRILERLARYMRLPEHKLFNHVAHVGNMSSASLPVALDAALASGRLQPGALVLLVGAGAGHCGGAVLLRIERPSS